MELVKTENKAYRVFPKSTFEIQKRDAEGGKDPEYVIRGYAALYDTPSDAAGWYTEVITRGAFSDAVGTSDIRALLNHDENEILARQKPGRSNNTLKVWDDEKGLAFEFVMPATRASLIEAIARGDIDQNSFAFTVKEETWIDENEDKETKTRREINKVERLYDISLVTYPFYEEASFEMEQRSYEAWKGKDIEPDKEEATTEVKEVNNIQELKTAEALLQLGRYRLINQKF